MVPFPVLNVQNLTKTYGKKTVVKNVSLLFSAHMLWDMFVFTQNICFFSFLRRKKKNKEKELHTLT